MASRETCLFCATKHAAQAIVLVAEAAKGYPEHLWLAVGHLAELEDETSAEYPEICAEARRIRLALMDQEGTYLTEDLMNLLRMVRQAYSVMSNMDDKVRVHKILYGGVTKRRKDHDKVVEKVAKAIGSDTGT